MAWTITTRGASGFTYSGGTTVGDTFTPTDGNIIVVLAKCSTGTTFTDVTGWANTTFAEIITPLQMGTGPYLHVWAAIVGATPGSGTAFIDVVSSASADAIVFEAEGANVSGTINAVFEQYDGASVYNATSPYSLPTLAPFQSATNLSLTIFFFNDAVPTVPAGYTTLGTYNELTAYYIDEADTVQTLEGTSFSYRTIGGIAMELNEASSGSSIIPQVAHHYRANSR